MGVPMGFDRYMVLRESVPKDNANACFLRNRGNLVEGSLRGVEEVVGGIRHAEFLADVRSVAAGRGRFAAFGVEPLDGCSAGEHTVAFVGDNVDEKPGNRIGVGRRSVGNGFAGDTAAVFRFPGGPGEMFTEGL